MISIHTYHLLLAPLFCSKNLFIQNFYHLHLLITLIYFVLIVGSFFFLPLLFEVTASSLLSAQNGNKKLDLNKNNQESS